MVMKLNTQAVEISSVRPRVQASAIEENISESRRSAMEVEHGWSINKALEWSGTAWRPFKEFVKYDHPKSNGTRARGG